MEAEMEWHPRFGVLRLKGDMRLWGRPELEEQLLKTFQSGMQDLVNQLVLNLAGITTLDTMGITALIRVLIECTKRRIGLRVVMPSGVAGESLRRVRVFEPWPSYKDEAAAVRAAGA